MRRPVGEPGSRGQRLCSLGEQLADRVLGDVVLALAEVVVANAPVPVDQVLRRPVLVLPRVPGGVAVVERDRVADAEAADVLGDVCRLALEGKLGRVDADDHEPVGAVARVPRLHVRERAQAVDARIRPEVDQDHLAAQLVQRKRPCVQPADDARDRRRLAVVREQASLLGRDALRVTAAGNLCELPLRRDRALDLLLQALGVPGDRGLQRPVGAERDRERGRADEHPGNPADEHRPRAERECDPAPGESDAEQRHCGARGIAHRQHHAVEADVAASGDHGHGGEHGPCAGDEHEPEARAEQKAAAERGRRTPRERGERPRYELAGTGPEERQRDDEEQRDREVAEQVLRQPREVEQPGGEEREDGEARHDARDDRERPSSGRPAGEHDREDGQYAWRDGRDEPGKDTDTD